MHAWNVEHGESIGHNFRTLFSASTQYVLQLVLAIGLNGATITSFKTKTCRNHDLATKRWDSHSFSPFGRRNVDMSNGWMRTRFHFIKVNNATTGPKGINQSVRFPMSQNHLLSLNIFAFPQVLDRKKCHQWWNNHGRPVLCTSFYIIFASCAEPWEHYQRNGSD